MMKHKVLSLYYKYQLCTRKNKDVTSILKRRNFIFLARLRIFILLRRSYTLSIPIRKVEVRKTFSHLGAYLEVDIYMRDTRIHLGVPRHGLSTSVIM